MGVILLKRKMTMGGGDDDGGADHGAGGGGDGCKGASFGGRGGSRYVTPLRSAQRALQVSKRERQVPRLAKTYQRHISGTSAAHQRLISGYLSTRILAGAARPASRSY